ncbi:CoA ester lyase [Phycicoccus endophyticus]|uniref:CoA ester lyase n=1 Tax=Phycicoccus endophyticus TaxID=1690220 RepID=A0A7G9QZD5_9MICO|nr:CoA ester lyase [Phycicoccus endophyticus]NHI19066.1 CoA ester lyase [Phycicoccus endophyticus]QNN48710.1 CoA ester lyase [Phycicoccus endophyticus]GGL32565.1 citryl-CoA lyase [Phycicoccus endophyticus]
MSAWLFVPGTRPDRFATAHAAGATAVVLDLEDAVAPGEKETARRHVAEAVAAPDAPAAWVRVNGAGTAWHAADLEALAGRPALAGVLLPKAERAEDVAAVVRRLEAPVVPLVESARGVRDCEELAHGVGVVTLAFGSLDYAVDIGAEPGGHACRQARWEVVQAARLAGVSAPVDGVTPDFTDDDVVTADALEARAEGCGGKLCIHPRQVPLVEAAFAPSDADLSWARRVVEAAGSGAAVALDGQMVDAPVLARARRILAARTS